MGITTTSIQDQQRERVCIDLLVKRIVKHQNNFTQACALLLF